VLPLLELARPRGYNPGRRYAGRLEERAAGAQIHSRPECTPCLLRCPRSVSEATFSLPRTSQALLIEVHDRCPCEPSRLKLAGELGLPFRTQIRMTGPRRFQGLSLGLPLCLFVHHLE
jgi:hypothetical protein